MTLMKQGSSRKQINTCTNVGCMDYVEHSEAESNILNIVLVGLVTSNRRYLATVTELKARY